MARLDWRRGTLVQAQPRAARHRPFRRRAPRDLPALHRGRRQLDADVQAERAGGQDREALADREGRRAGHGRRPLGRRPPLLAPRHRRRRRPASRRPSRSSTTARCPTCSRSAATSTRAASSRAASFVADGADDEVPEQVLRQARLAQMADLGRAALVVSLGLALYAARRRHATPRSTTAAGSPTRRATR